MSTLNFILYKSGDEYHWLLRAKNGEDIAHCARGYARKGNCVRMLQKCAEAFGALGTGTAPFIDQTRKGPF